MGFPYYITMLKMSGEFRLFTGYGAASEVRAPDSGTITLYQRDKAGVAELFYKNDSDVERDLSLVGAIPTVTGVAGQVAIFTGTTAVGGDTDLTFVTDTLTATKIVGSTSITTPALTDSGMTLGSVLFAGTGGLISQDNTNLFWDNTNKQLGISSPVPLTIFETADTGVHTLSGVLFGRYTNDTSSSAIILRKARGTRAVPIVPSLGDVLGILSITGFTTGTTYYQSAAIRAVTTEAFSATAGGANLQFFTTPNTTHAIAQAMTLFQSGGLSVGSTTDPAATGIINANTGFRIANAAASGNVLRGNGTNFISAALALTDITPRAHSSLTSLTVDDHTQYALLAGRSGGQILTGGTGADEILKFVSTSNATRGSFAFRGGLTADFTPNTFIHIKAGAAKIKLEADGSDGGASKTWLLGTAIFGPDACAGIGLESNHDGCLAAYNREILRFGGSSNTLLNIIIGGNNTNNSISPGAGRSGLIFLNDTALSSMASTTAGLFADSMGANVEMVSIDQSNRIRSLAWPRCANVTTQFDKTNDAALANITGLTHNVNAGKTYSFEAILDVSPNITGGSQYAIAGTATATSIVYFIELLDDTTNVFTITSRQTALGGATGQAGTTAGRCKISGTIIVNAAGTLTVQFAQNVATLATTSSVLINSRFTVDQLP